MVPVEKLIIREPAYCAGFHLAPLTLGHYLILCDRGSAYVSGDWEHRVGIEAFNELVIALTLCRFDYDIAHALLSTTSKTDFDKAINDTKATIIQADKNIVSVSNTFSAWWLAHTAAPEVEELTSGLRQSVGTEFALRLMSSASRVLGLDAHKATRTSYGLILRAHVHDMEERGHCRLLTDERQEQIARAMEQTEREAEQDAQEG